MRVVIQRVKHASVTIDGNVKSAIQKGLLILLGIGENDGEDDIKWLVNKVASLRIFDDEQGVMNKSVMEIGGEALSFRSLRLWQVARRETVQATFMLPNTRFPFRFTNVSAKS